jgi:hypothetical protein
MLGLRDGGDRTMESMGDFYAIALHDDQLRAGLVAMHRERGHQRPPLRHRVRSALAIALRGVAAVVDAPRPVARAEQSVPALQ